MRACKNIQLKTFASRLSVSYFAGKAEVVWTLRLLQVYLTFEVIHQCSSAVKPLQIIKLFGVQTAVAFVTFLLKMCS